MNPLLSIPFPLFFSLTLLVLKILLIDIDTYIRSAWALQIQYLWVLDVPVPLYAISCIRFVTFKPQTSVTMLRHKYGLPLLVVPSTLHSVNFCSRVNVASYMWITCFLRPWTVWTLNISFVGLLSSKHGKIYRLITPHCAVYCQSFCFPSLPLCTSLPLSCAKGVCIGGVFVFV